MSNFDSRAAFSLGSNLGDREGALAHAVDRLGAVAGYRIYGSSAVYVTEPVGGPQQPDYLNQVVVLVAEDESAMAETADRARSLLAVCQSIERDLDRRRAERWGPRTMDVDILAVGAYATQERQVSEQLSLTVPHPRLTERAFVLVPWLEVDPEFVVPGQGSVAELAAGLSEKQRASVVRLIPFGTPDSRSDPTRNLGP